MSELAHLRDGGEALNEAELVATCILLLFAGRETIELANDRLQWRDSMVLRGLQALRVKVTRQWRGDVAAAVRHAYLRLVRCT